LKPYLGISCGVVGLYGTVSGTILPGLLFIGAGLILANFFRQTRSDPR